MAKTIVALYDSYIEAQEVERELTAAGFPDSDSSIITYDAAAAGTPAAVDRGTDLVGRLTDMGVPRNEAEDYAEGVRRGGTLVTLRVDDNKVDDAADIMERRVPVDVEARGAQWREGGWTGYDQTAAPYSTEEAERERERYAARDTDTTEVTRGEQGTAEVVEEELRVGKRQVERGGVRVHTHVTETPVEEQVTLREERVNVERHQVDRPASEADLREETVEVTETAEEPVVSKEARVVEEVVISKEVGERTETVHDTVRRKDIEIEELEPDFQRDYQTRFADRDSTYEQIRPAYRYGYNLATHDYYRGRDWCDIEPEARRDWEARNPGTWDDYRDAVRRGWERTRDRT